MAFRPAFVKKRLGVRVDARPSGTPRVKHSAFFITINTNKGGGQCDSGKLAQEFDDLLDELFGVEKNFYDIIKFLVPGHTVNKNIKDVDNMYVTEVGQIMGRVHGHVLSQIRHTSRIHINRYKLEEFFIRRVKTCKLSSLHIHIKCVGYSLNLGSYFRKYYRKETGKDPPTDARAMHF